MITSDHVELERMPKPDRTTIQGFHPRPIAVPIVSVTLTLGDWWELGRLLLWSWVCDQLRWRFKCHI